tara:strand:- start:1130 stop:3109 length:1980 start_codon:yes stop_codon:yes gene_type:complete
MKVKGITIWEQYAEFIAIGIVAVVLVVYVVFQLSDDTNAVNVGGKTLGPDAVDTELQAKSEALARRIRDDADAPVTLEMPDPMSSRFETAMASNVSPAETLRIPRAVVVLDAGSSVDVSGQPYVVPMIHPAQQPVTMQFFDGLDDSVVQNYPALQEQFESGPYDTTWITAAAVFDAESILQQYRNAGPSNELPLRDKWYNGRVDIIDVVVEREELVDGVWSNLQQVDLIPGQVSFREQVKGEVGAATRDEVIGQLARPGVQESIIRPSFLLTRNSDWVHPAMYGGEGEGANTLLILKRRFKTLAKQIEDTELQLEQLGGPGGGAPGGGSAPGGSGGLGGMGGGGGGGLGGMGGGGGSGGLGGSGGGGSGGLGGMGGGIGGSGTGGSASGSGSRREREMKRKRLERDLVRYERQMRDISEQLQELGVDIGEGGSLDLDFGSSLEEVWTWVHDMNIVPDHVYRYRFTIKVYNPFFAKKLSLIPDQHELADDFMIDSITSDWSEPVRVEPFVRYYITRAVPSGFGAASGNLGFGQAEAEVFRFHDSRWHNQTFPLQPGDRIGGVRRISLAQSAEDAGSDGASPAGESGDPDDGRMIADEVDIDFGTGLYVLEILPNADLNPSQVKFGREATVVLAPLDPSLDLGLEIRDPRADGERAKPSGD